MDPALLEILCCPESHQPLAPAPAEVLARLNAQIAAGQVRNRAGQLVQEPLEAGFIRSDGQWLYPIRKHLPILLVDEAIPLSNSPANTSDAAQSG